MSWLSVKKKQPIKQILGRVVYVWENFWETRFSPIKTVDQTIPDYRYWDRFRNCLITGYEISGLYAQGLIELISSWVIGRAVLVRLSPVDDKRMQQKIDYTNDMLRRFFLSIQGELIQIYKDVLGLGDQFVVVNPDGSLTIIPPDSVEIVYDPLDYRKINAIRIHTILDSVKIVDEYTSTTRTVTYTEQGLLGPKTSTKTFRVLIGRIPIVHFANDRGRNETRGRPIYESLLRLFSEMNDIIKKGLQGSKVAGNPIPVFENLFDPQETIDRMATADDDNYLDKDGNDETRRTIRWDEQSAIVLGEGGQFKFASPPVGFTDDILHMAQALFHIMLNRFHTPEQLWGVGLQIGKGVEEQNAGWARYIESRRDLFAGTSNDEKLGTVAQGGLHELADIWLRMKRLTDTKIFVSATVISWSDITEEDKTLTFNWVKYLVSRGALTVKTALTIAGLVEDVDDEFENAQAEMLTAAANQQTEFDDTGGQTDPNLDLTGDNTPDLRKKSGADAPRGGAYGGGGKTQ